MRSRESIIHRSAAARRLARAVLAGLGVVCVLSGGMACGRRASREQVEAAQKARAQQLLESGNQAYKMGDYRLAARRYAAAAVVKKDDPAAYFGMGMALSKLGRDEEARAAYARSRELSRTQAALEWKGSRKGAAAETVRAGGP